MGSSSLTRKMPFIAHASGSPVCGPGVLQLPFQVSRSYWTLRQHPELLNRNCQLQFSVCFTDEIREPHPCRGQLRKENEVGQVLRSVCSEQSLDGDGQRTLWARESLAGTQPDLSRSLRCANQWWLPSTCGFPRRSLRSRAWLREGPRRASRS